ERPLAAAARVLRGVGLDPRNVDVDAVERVIRERRVREPHRDLGPHELRGRHARVVLVAAGPGESDRRQDSKEATSRHRPAPVAAHLQVACVRDTSAPDRGVTSPVIGEQCDAGRTRVGIDSVWTSDAEVVRRVLAGDTGAYAALVARYRDRLARYAVPLLGNREDAEEALQDAFVRAYRSLERCDDAARFGAWLYGILVSRCRTKVA